MSLWCRLGIHITIKKTVENKTLTDNDCCVNIQEITHVYNCKKCDYEDKVIWHELIIEGKDGQKLRLR